MMSDPRNVGPIRTKNKGLRETLLYVQFFSDVVNRCPSNDAKWIVLSNSNLGVVLFWKKMKMETY